MPSANRRKVVVVGAGAVGLAMVRITAAILRGQNSVLTVSTRRDGEFGLQGVCLSVPCLVSSSGVERVVESDLPENEREALSASAAKLRDAIGQLATAG